MKAPSLASNAELTFSEVKASNSTEELLSWSFVQTANSHHEQVKLRVLGTIMVFQVINLICSLIVLPTTAATLHIFNQTKTFQLRNSFHPWAVHTKTWPQMSLLVAAIMSLVPSIVILHICWRVVHGWNLKPARSFKIFIPITLLFTIIMWAVAAHALHSSKRDGHDNSIWGWSCRDGKERELFHDVVYALICRMQVSLNPKLNLEYR